MDSREILFQFAPDSSWPASDGAWVTDRAVDIDAASDGAGQVQGQATGEKRYGKIKRPYDDDFTIDPMPLTEPSLGRWCRLLYRDSQGAVVVPSIGRFTAFWWGFVAATRREFGGTVHEQNQDVTWGRASFYLSGIMAHFGQVYVIDGVEVSGSQAPQESGTAHPFNSPVPNRSTGQVYQHPLTGVQCYVPNTDERGSGTPGTWTAKQAMEYLIAYHFQKHGPWMLDDQSGSAGEIELPAVETFGRRLVDVVNEIANERTGLTYRVEEVNHRPTLILLKYPPDDGFVLDVRSDRKIKRIELYEDTTLAADHVIVTGERPCNTVTLSYATSGTPNLEPMPGWNSTSNVNAADPHDTAWRGYRLKAGAQVPGLRTVLEKNGSGSYTGVRTQAGSGAGPSSKSAKMDRFTGWAPNGTSPTVGPVDPDNRGPIRIFVRGSASATSWEDWSDRISVLPVMDPPGIELGGSASQISAISDKIKAGGELRVTVGLREAAPLRKSSRTTAGKQRGDRELVRQVRATDEAWSAGNTDAPTASVNAGSTVPAPEPSQTIDQTAPLGKALDRLTAGYQRAAQTAVSYEARGLYFSVPVGTCITTLRTQAGDIDCAAVIVRRSWVFREGSLSTSYDTERPQEGRTTL